LGGVIYANEPTNGFTTWSVSGSCSACTCTENSDGTFNFDFTCNGTTGVCASGTVGGTTTINCDGCCNGGIVAGVPYEYDSHTVTPITSTKWKVRIVGVVVGN